MSEQASKMVEDDGSSAKSADLRVGPCDEPALVRRSQGGDVEAFGELVRRYQDRIYNMVYRMCSRPEDAEELTQEAFLRAYKNIRRFRMGSRFYTWVFRIARNLTISHRRRGRRVKFHSLNHAAEQSAPSEARQKTAELASRRNPGPQAVAAGRETARRITKALGELDEQFRVVVLLRDIEGLNYGEIAEILDLPTGTIKSRLHRGRSFLKEKLADLMD